MAKLNKRSINIVLHFVVASDLPPNPPT
jgi:hypothetical protein